MQKKSRRIHKGLSLVYILSVLIIQCLIPISDRMVCQAAEYILQEEKLYAQSAVLMDGTTGRVLYGKNGQQAMPNASTTKIMTCIVALENAELDEIVEVSALAAAAPRVHLGMRKGQQFYLQDLLYGLMLESFNDCAVAIAQHVAGSVEEFAAMMNAKARQIGCENTQFVTPNGLDADGHYTTAADLALIMRYCVTQSPQAEQFLAITQTANYSFSEIGTGTTYSCYNHNALLQMMEGAISGKTGYTSKAGYCYIGAVKRDGNLYIVALLACGWPNHKSYKWADMRTMIQYALDTYLYRTFEQVEQLNLPERLTVLDAKTDRIDEELQLGIVCELPEDDGLPQYEGMLMADNEQVEIQIEVSQQLVAPVEQNERIGAVHYLVDGECYRHVLLYVDGSAERKDFAWCMQKVWELFLC